MKRPSDDEDARGSSSDSNAEEFVSRFLRRHPRFFVYVGIGIGALIVIAFVVAKFSSSGR